MFAQLAQDVEFVRPAIDWHAAAPELTLLGFGALVTLMDIIWLERGRRLTSAVASIALLVTMIPIFTLAIDGTDRSMFGGAFVVDDYALVMKGLFVLAGYVVILLSTNYVAEGDYWENEYYGLLLSSVLGMILMASARDLITIFVALELLSIPAYMLATWRKRDLKSNEAGLKYYLMGVFASAIMLYGMSLLYGGAGSTLLVDINPPSASSQLAGCGHRDRRHLRDHRLRLQGLGVPVPHLGTGHLRRSTDPDHCVLVRCVQGGWLRGLDEPALRWASTGATMCTSR